MKYFYELPAFRNGSQAPWIPTRHLKMRNEEIDRIFRIASEPFRIAWEARRNDGQSLLELKKVLETAVAQEKVYRKKRTFWFRSIIVCVPLAMFLQWYYKVPAEGNNALLSLALIMCPFVPLAMVSIRANENWFKQNDEILRCDTIFQQFALSLGALNPLGTGNSYHDVIDHSYVKDRALSLAVRVVDAQTTFDTIRTNPEAGRYEVIHAGEWIGKCEADLEKFESNLDKDFGLSLDKPSIFKAAEAYLAKARPRA